MEKEAMENRAKEIKDKVHTALLQAFDETFSNNGMRTVVPIRGTQHQVVAYAVGQNQIRIDLRFARSHMHFGINLFEDQVE